uniref:Bifunctional inhibitor/plant lipid transfer protein/seed storage helical domain-containing protein n=1 Tax=Leersia perrieri TaxID=77586 RepID=A0A0D9WYN2_9ORYZ
MSSSKAILFLAFALLAAAALPSSHAVRWPFLGGIRPWQPSPVPEPTAPAPPQEPPAIPTSPVSQGSSKPVTPSLPTMPVSPDNKPQDPSPAAPANDCFAPLVGLVSCFDYLNDPSATTPMESCCGAFGSVVDEAPMCLCHAITGDISQIMPEPVNAARIVSLLPRACGVGLPLQKLTHCSTEPVPPLFPTRT